VNDLAVGEGGGQLLERGFDLRDAISDGGVLGYRDVVFGKVDAGLEQGDQVD
jgi:hypothetical protein